MLGLGSSSLCKILGCEAKENLSSWTIKGKVYIYIGWMLFIMAVLLMYGGLNYYLLGRCIFLEWVLFDLQTRRVVVTLIFDWISLSFVGAVFFISSMVFFYRSVYMRGDLNFYRFVLLVYLFVMSMMIMILSPNMIRILLG